MLNRKITGKTHAWGGMVPTTFATAYYLHRKGEQVNWLSFWEQHEFEKEQKTLQQTPGDSKATTSKKRKRPDSLIPTGNESENESEEAKKCRADRTPTKKLQSNCSRVRLSDLTDRTEKHSAVKPIDRRKPNISTESGISLMSSND